MPAPVLVFTNTATDADLPPDTLTFSLTSGPAGAAITPAGVFSWTAPQVSTPQTNSATVRVTDNGTSPLSASRSFTIAVVPPPKISSCAVSNSAVNLTWSTYPGKTYRMLYKDALDAPSWTPLGSDSVSARLLALRQRHQRLRPAALLSRDAGQLTRIFCAARNVHSAERRQPAT